MQMQTLTPLQKRVDIIPANILLTKPNARKRKLRVAAYCRVSTEQEEQQSSYAAQIAYYTDKISKNKDWEIAGILPMRASPEPAPKSVPSFSSSWHCVKR
jgi:hypothetical protein